MLRALAISALAVLALTACQETETSLDQHAPSAPVEEAKIAPPPAQAELTNARGFMTAIPWRHIPRKSAPPKAARAMPMVGLMATISSASHCPIFKARSARVKCSLRTNLIAGQ